MKSIGVLVAAFLVSGLGPLVAAGPDIGLPGIGPVPKDYIVGFHDAVPRDLQPGAQYNGGEVIEVDEPLKWIVVHTMNPILFEATVHGDDRVRYIEWDDPAYAVPSFVPNDSRYGDAGHWGSKKIGAEAAWDRTRGSTAVKVAMIDSGLNKNHEEYAGSGRVLQGHDFHNGDTDPNDESACSYHGTHTTGTAGATINNGKGIAGMSQHTILPVKGLGGTGCSGGLSNLASALRYARDQGAHVSSNSWGGGGVSTTLNDAIQYAHDGGVIHVAAAGNSGPCSNCVSQPWKSKASIVIIVASTTSSDTQSSFSSEGAEVDVAAPGSSILSSTSGTTGYGTLSGTSMATPHVSGTAGLIKALQPTYTFSQMESRLRSTAVDLGPAGCDVDFGCGRISADAATNGLGGGGATAPGAPSLSATAGNAQVSLSWTTPSDGGSAITGYRIYRGTTSGGETLLTSVGVQNSYTNTGLTNGVTYYYQVSAVNSVGEGARSNEVSATPSGGETQVYFDNFDGASTAWTKSTGSSDLWRRGSGCLGARSPSNALQYNRGSTACDYSTGARTTGWAQSPVVNLGGKSSATMRFYHAWETETYSGGAYDIMRIQVSTNSGSTWTTLQQWDSRNANQLSFQLVSYDVSAYVSTGFRARVFFDSVDGTANGFRGWNVDDFEILAG